MYTVQGYFGEHFFDIYKDRQLLEGLADYLNIKGKRPTENRLTAEDFIETDELGYWLVIVKVAAQVIGYGKGFIGDTADFTNKITFPYTPEHCEQERLSEALTTWFNMVGSQGKIIIIERLEVLPEHQGNMLATMMTPVVKHGTEIGIDRILFQTHVDSPVFKISLGSGCIPLPITVNPENRRLLLMSGSTTQIGKTIMDGASVKRAVSMANQILGVSRR